MNSRSSRHPSVLVPITAAALLGASALGWAAPSGPRTPNAAPLGFEISVAKLADVRAQLGDRTTLKAAGTNKFSGGPMLVSNGAGLGIDGLQEITFIFDEEEVLQGVLLTLPKRFRPTFETLRKKYKVVSQRIPFVGDAHARFSQGASAIILDAPHLSFEMSLHYLSDRLLATFESRSARDQARHEKEQADRL